MSEKRPLRAIGSEITRYWPFPDYRAARYADMMTGLTPATGTEAQVIRGFLSFSGPWHGKKARAIRAELRARLEEAS